MSQQKYFEAFSSRDVIIRELSGYDTDKNAWLARNPDFPTERQILWASYNYEDYSGTADMIFKKNGKLYHYSGSHCSCNGLEEEGFRYGPVTWKALDGFLFSGHTTEALEALKKLIKKNLDKKAKM